MADVGAAFNGDEEEQGLKSIVSGAGTALNRSIFDDPASRSALLQIGLNLMQPQALGQTGGGHLAQGIGSGGEAVGRIEEADQKERFGQGKLDELQRRNDISQQRADSYAERVRLGLDDKISSNLQYTAEHNRRMELLRAKDKREEEVNAEAKRKYDMFNGPAAASLRGTDPDFAKYNNKSEDMIKEIIRQDLNRVKGVIPDADAPPSLKPPIRVQRGTQPRSPDEPTDALPPVKERKLGVTRYKGHVWGKDAAGKTGWVPDEGEE